MSKQTLNPFGKRITLIAGVVGIVVGLLLILQSPEWGVGIGCGVLGIVLLVLYYFNRKKNGPVS